MPTLVFISDAAQTTHKHHADGRAYIKAFLVYFHRSTPEVHLSYRTGIQTIAWICGHKGVLRAFFEKTHFQLAVMLRVFRAQ